MFHASQYTRNARRNAGSVLQSNKASPSAAKETAIMSNSRRIDPTLLALDADGVLVDYHAAYAQAWGRAFGETPAIADPLAYWAKDRYGVRQLGLEEREHFRTHFDHGFWSTMQAIPGALQAAKDLKSAGFKLVCVSAIRPQHRAAREANLRDLGFPIDEVHGASDILGDTAVRSPKADALTRLMPAAFVDDFLPYLRGTPPEIHCALIHRGCPNGTPNQGEELAALVHSEHADLADFARFWIARR